MKPLESRIECIRVLALDVDGVLTDGSIFMDNLGQEYKAFHVRDGHGLKLLQRAGIQIALITGRSSGVVEARARDLGITYVYQGALDKRLPFVELKKSTGVADHEIAYMGDDVVDLPILSRVGLAAAPADAHEAVLEQVQFVSRHAGGRGAVRELCDLLLRGQGRMDELMAQYLSKQGPA
ncbi:HAD-IIIA family hydrolase [Thermithiobacillus plumbiphilus]|uniref:HAD-IIIA family hydrolase n=1 Tax=Thermithiobacillus plumbiphilus TaxID=1729899 RepID=A0ABU9D8U6_9PROT